MKDHPGTARRRHVAAAGLRIERPRLQQRLHRAQAGAIAVVIGRAGMGKSELLRPYRDDETALYFRAGKSHATFARFVGGLAHAVAPVAPAAQDSFSRAWERAIESRSPGSVLGHWLAEHLDGTGGRIVIDDLHTGAGDPNVAAFLTVLGERRGAAGLTIAVREPGRLPLALWMATRRLDRPIGDDDLAFDAGEREAAAALFGISPAAMHADADPVAFMYAAAHQHERGDATHYRSFDDVARAIARRRSAEERATLFVTALLPSLDAALLHATDCAEPADFGTIFGDDGPFMLDRTAPAQLRFFDRYHDRIAAEFEQRDDAYRRSVALLAIGALEQTGRHAAALNVATREHLTEAAGRLLDEHGFGILQAGDVDTIGEALDAVESKSERLTSRAMALRGYIDARSGRLDTSEAWFRHALEEAHDDVTRAPIALVYAHELALRRRSDAGEVLAPLADATMLAPDVLGDVRSAYAQALAVAGRFDEARTRTDAAVAALAADAPDALRARVLARAAYVALECGAPAIARERAAVAAPLAEAAALYDVAASAYSVLYNIAYEIDDDAHAGLHYLQRLRAVAVKSGTLKLGLYAQIGIYHLHADVGSEAALLELDREIAAADKHDATHEILEGLVPARALQAAWHGRFLDAARLLRPTIDFQPTAERRALCEATIALYDAAAGERDAAAVERSSAAASLEAGEPRTTHFVRTQLTLGLAAWAAGDLSDARRWLTYAADHAGERATRLRALARTMAALLADRTAGSIWSDDVGAALAELRAQGYGGMALLIEAIPDPGSARSTTVGERVAQGELTRRFATAVNAADSGSLQRWLGTLPGTMFTELPLQERFARWMSAQPPSDERSCNAMLLVERQLAAFRPPAPAIARLDDDVDTAIEALFALLDVSAPLMAEHSRAVSAWCSRIARALGLAPAATEYVTRCGLIHDIGKVETPPEILNAARKLSNEEWAVMREHAAAGARMIADHPLLREFVPIVRGHHERLDGNGYPDQLRGCAIPLAARIVSVADSFNAMIGRRPYRLPMTPNAALAELERHRNTQFDPEIVDAMQRVVLARVVDKPEL